MNRGGLGERAVNGFIKELKASPSHLEVGSPGSWRCGRKRRYCKESEVKQLTVWRDRDERAPGTLGLNQDLESLAEVGGGAL